MPWLLWLAAVAATSGNLVVNGDLEAAENGFPHAWAKAWARDGEQTVRTEYADGGVRGPRCLHLVHTGTRDWSLSAPTTRNQAVAGEVFELSVQVKLTGPGQVVLCAMFLPDKGDQGAIWAAGQVVVTQPIGQWQTVRTRCLAPAGLPRFTPRLIGHGPAAFLMDDFQVVALGRLADLRGAYSGPHALSWTSEALQVELQPDGLDLAVTDRRSGRRWRLAGSGTFLPNAVQVRGADVRIDGADVLSGHKVQLDVGVASPLPSAGRP